mgnify:CR=1 FL=1
MRINKIFYTKMVLTYSEFTVKDFYNQFWWSMQVFILCTEIHWCSSFYEYIFCDFTLFDSSTSHVVLPKIGNDYNDIFYFSSDFVTKASWKWGSNFPNIATLHTTMQHISSCIQHIISEYYFQYKIKQIYL